MLLQKLPRVLQILQVVLEHSLRDLGLGLLSDHLAEVGLIAMLEGGCPLRFVYPEERVPTEEPEDPPYQCEGGGPSHGAPEPPMV